MRRTATTSDGSAGASSSDALAEARAALVRHDWSRAYDVARAAVASTSEPAGEALEVLAEAAWWTGRLDESITARDRSYLVYARTGNRRGAGRTAWKLCDDWGLKGNGVVSATWQRRARRALDDEVECAEYGFLLVSEAETAQGARDVARAEQLARSALELGTRIADSDVEALALQALGRILIDRGSPAEGLAYLDEAMLSAMQGQLSPLLTGWVHCSLIGACHELGDIRRANEWLEATCSWAEGHPFTIFPGLCRLHRAEIMRWRGEWLAAEQEARRACDELQAVHVPVAAAAWAEVGDIRRRLGDLDGAEAAFAKAEALGSGPGAGLALLRLAQGRVEAADRVITTALEDAADNRLRRAWLLPAEVQMAVAVGDLARGSRAAAELGETAATYASAALLASAATAAGQVQLAADDPAACATLRRAVERWAGLNVPHEVATARVLLARACLNAGDQDGAARSMVIAKELMNRIGGADATAAEGGAADVARLRADANTPAPQAEIVARMERRGELWQVVFRGTDIVLSDLKGLQYLAVLLAAPGREFPALELCGGHEIEGAIPVIDEQARKAYRRRLAEVEQDIAEAEYNNDTARAGRARCDREFLLAELSSAVGLGGRLRGTGGVAERARTSVTRSLRYALTRLAEQHAALGEHLSRTVHTGRYCIYEPDPVTPITWTVSWG